VTRDAITTAAVLPVEVLGRTGLSRYADAVTTFSRRGLHGHVVNVLGERILRGDFQPGDILDPEELLVNLEVSRTVLREAIKVLGAKGLVDARPRHGTFITDRSTWRLLDDDVMAWRTAGAPDPTLVHELGEVRQIIEPAAARLAAIRHSEEQLTQIKEALDDMASDPGRPSEQVSLADVAFHRGILTAAGNELLEQFEVLLGPALHARNSLAFTHDPTKEFLQLHTDVYRAIAARDAGGAYKSMNLLIAEASALTSAIMAPKGP
jgi:GntR family transcriptional regulator, galactonate operon transcriptional repressor